ncbi:hypothetical protein [Streptomyces violaceus]|uniref:Ku domain-containing protein n=1 Tax=Streptomyces violaceus TaxID=1936 RepID=A0ABY9TZX6_STRVL|nr:hypothetical protein [Streptomyces janthinus]WND15978.1 hypothetical protein RI060_00770 [Streptomyces janthinus]GGT00523.1 hypothetical protein GCM10010270_85400 [Streptomyces janthinus]
MIAQIIEAKREHREPPRMPEPGPEDKPGKVVDLMAALRESVQKARASRGEDADVHELPKKKAAKKQPGEEDGGENDHQEGRRQEDGHRRCVPSTARAVLRVQRGAAPAGVMTG